jgi:hypothetical protein
MGFGLYFIDFPLPNGCICMPKRRKSATNAWLCKLNLIHFNNFTLRLQAEMHSLTKGQWPALSCSFGLFELEGSQDVFTADIFMCRYGP